MQDGSQEDSEETKVVKTGILKGGKLWKNGGEGRKSSQSVEETKTLKVEEPKRSVRFSGRDEFTTLEAAAVFDKLPLDITNEAALACFLSPKFQELSALLEDQHGDWHVDLSPLTVESALEHLKLDNLPDISFHHSCAKHPHKMNHHQLNDEQISESVQRYEEMRRRVAAAEGRDNNSICSDESKSSSDSQSSDSTTTETRIRRLENADVAHVAGGVMRSNSEVRRAIERNALRRSLIRFAEARKKDTNKNEKSEKQESSLIEKLKWLTASEDATNGNADEVSEEDQEMQHPKLCPESNGAVDHHMSQCTIEHYRKLADMFNRTTAIRYSDINVPIDIREWKLEADLFKSEQGKADLDIDDLPPGTMTYTAVPAVSVCDQISDEEAEKLIYSGGVRYTKEGTLPAQNGSVVINGPITVTIDQPPGSDADTYTVDDIDEALHDDRSSSVPSSSQSSPRLSGRSDVDGASTAESGYSSNETNSELSQILPPELDELAEFVKQDAVRIERVRRRFDEPDDHGFSRRPSVRGIKPRFGSTTDLLKQMANQLVPPPITQLNLIGSNMSWSYSESGEEDNGAAPHIQRRRIPVTRNTPLPALQEEVPYGPSVDSLYPPVPTSSMIAAANTSDNKGPLVYSSPEDMHGHAPSVVSSVRDSQNDYIQHGNPSDRLQSYASVPLGSHFGSTQSLIVQQSGNVMTLSNELQLHHPSCTSRRPVSVHGHAPTDMLISGPQHPTPPRSLPIHQHTFHSISQCQSHEDPGRCGLGHSHPPFGSRGSYPSAGSSGSYSQMHDHHNNLHNYQHPVQAQTSPVENDPLIEYSSNNCANQKTAGGHGYNRAYCPRWHPPNSNTNFVLTHSNTSNNVPIVSSHLSYTTPIVPEGSNPRPPGVSVTTGVFTKVETERGVPEVVSSSSRIALDPQCPASHHQSTRESGLILHHNQVMNVST